MLSARHNTILAKVMGLISSVFSITLTQDVPFHQPQQSRSKVKKSGQATCEHVKLALWMHASTGNF